MKDPMARVTAFVAMSTLLAGCAGNAVSGNPAPRASGPERTLTILAASSLTSAFSALARTYESAHPGTRVTFSFAGSDTLASQIVQGAPADLFASASPTQMDTVVKLGKTDGAPQEFATNRLVVVTPPDNPAHITSIDDLANEGTTVVLAAPGVPAGDYAREVFQKLGIYRAVTTNVVSNELDDQSVLSKIRLGEADAGVVYVSDLSGGAKGQVHAVRIPASSNVIATYEIAPLSAASDPADAKAFEEFVLSDEGRSTLVKFGFGEH
ncbi:MAG: molybdate ABC transporter substrate-binding protein [Actinomycetota bacterium]|nr:molybdate ABC transporter substrate-binding protein [Actinomycetota bacterium]